jgi:hypothetical protein
LKQAHKPIITQKVIAPNPIVVTKSILKETITKKTDTPKIPTNQPKIIVPNKSVLKSTEKKADTL